MLLRGAVIKVSDEHPYASSSLEPRFQCDLDGTYLWSGVSPRFVVKIRARIDNTRKILSARHPFAVYDYEMVLMSMRVAHHNFPKSSRAFAALRRFNHVFLECSKPAAG